MESSFAAYAGTPLLKKLGIRAGATVGLLGAPDGFVQLLNPLPEGAVLQQGLSGPVNVALWFVRWRRELEGSIASLVPVSARGPLWIAWPKKASGEPTDLVQQDVREAGLAAGMVDYKICSIDATWSALAFRKRRGRR